MVDQQQLPIQHARLALSSLIGPEKLLDQVLTDSGLTAESIQRPKFPFSTRTLDTVANNMTRLLGPAWFLNLPVIWSLRAQSEFGSAIRFSSTLGESIDLIVEFTHVRWPLARVERFHRNGEVVLCLHQVESLSPRNLQMIGAIAALCFQTTFEAMVGEDLTWMRSEFAGAPPSYEARLAGLLKGPSSWGHDAYRVFIPERMLDRTSLTADEVSHAAMLASLRALATSRARELSVSTTVHAALRDAGSDGFGAEAVAEKLGLTRRTLERRLKDEGTSFREIQDAAFKQRLLSMASDSGYTAERVAEELGYHDASSLQRACRRWFGKTFGAVRNERRGR